MMKHLLHTVIAVCVGAALVGSAAAQDKLKIGSAVQVFPPYYLPISAAQQKGIFKKNGLDVEWVPSQSGADLTRAFAASAIKIALSAAATDTLAIARGVPLSVIGNLQPYDDFAIWSSSKGHINKGEDLKGGKIGVSRFGGLEHSYAQLAAKKFGIDNDVQFVSTGGINESLAALVTGSIDAVVLPVANMLTLKLEGKVREIAEIKSFLPKDWISYSVAAQKDFIANDPGTVKKVVQSIFEANRFIMSAEGKPWAVAKMKEINNYSDKGAAISYDTLGLSQDGKIGREGFKNLLDFMSEYQILKKDEVPPVEKIVDDQFVK
jgi:NitT/TauT family transport system substrate-binding protein